MSVYNSSQTSDVRAQRRTETREALLDATIDSLVELGYGATTTRGVAKRAGVSQGAQQHYFPSKAALVDAAIHRLTVRFADEVSAAPLPGSNERERAESLVERLWEMHNLPIGHAVFELFNAARTDAAIAKRVALMLESGSSLTYQVVCELLPGYAEREGFENWLLVTMAAMRGTVILTAIPDIRAGAATWPMVREQILDNLNRLMD